MPLCSVADDKLSRKIMNPSSCVKKVPTVLLEHREEMRRNKDVFEETAMKYLIPAKAPKSSSDASRLMTYSEIHAENVRSRDENLASEEGYGRIHRMQLQAQSDRGKKCDTGSLDKRNTASLPLYPSSDSNQTQSIDTQRKAEQMNELENDSYHEVVEWCGPGKRFYEAKGQRKPTPYHTNALDGPREVQLAMTDSKSVSRESSALKNILIKKLEAPLQLLKAFSASSFSLLKNDKVNGVKGGAVSKRNPRDDDRIQSERSKQRNSHIYDGGSIIELADDDSYCAHYDRIQSIKQAQKQGRGQGRLKEGSTPAAGYSVLQTERSAIRKRRAPTSYLTDATANSKSKQQDFFGIMSQSNNHIKEDNRYTEKSDQKEKVKFLENSILEHISGRLGNLRHSLNKMDFSRSGVLNYEEFKSVIAQRGVNMLPRDVEKVFQERAIDSRDKGQINEGGVTSHDLRYSRGLAVNIQQYIEHLSEREKERVEVVPRERSSSEECFSDRLKFVNKDFLFQRKDDDQRLLQDGNNAHTYQRNEATTSSSRRRPTVIPPSGPRSDHHLLGSNLSDEEFKILLEVVGTSHDGKISLSEFDKIAKCSMINSTTGSKHGSSNNGRNHSKSNNDCNGLLPSNSTHEYPSRDVDFDVLNYEKFDKNHKIDWEKVREIRRNSARNISLYNTEQEQYTSSKSSNAAMCHHQYQSTEVPHQMPRGRDFVPDSRARRSHSLNGLGSSRPQGMQGSFRQNFASSLDSFDKYGTQGSWTSDSIHSAPYTARPIQAHIDRELNKIKNFSSISFDQHERVSHAEALTSRDRKRSVAQPQYAHTRDPSRFWEFSQTSSSQRDTFPVYQSTTSYRHSTPYVPTPHVESSRDMRRTKSFTGSSSAPHTGPAAGIPLGIATGDIKSVQSTSESTTHPLAVRFTVAPVKEKETSSVIANLLKAFQVDEKVTQPSVNTQDATQKKIRSVSAPAGRPSIPPMQGSSGTGTGYQGVPPCLRGTKTLTPGGAGAPLGEGFNPGYAVTPVNMRSNTRFASSSEESSLGTSSNKCSASTSGTTSPYESNSQNVSKYNGGGYVTSSSIGNALKNLNMNNQQQNNNNDTLSENAKKLQNLIPKCLSVRNTSVPNPSKKTVPTTRYPEYTESDSTKTTPVASRIEVPGSTPEAEKSFSHVFSPRKGLNIPPPRSHILVGGGGKK